MNLKPLGLLPALAALLATPVLHADEDDPAIPYSYSNETPQKAVIEAVPGLISWAEAELDEHREEGLYRHQAIEEANTQAMISIAKELFAKGKLLVENGDADKATSQFLAAEAVARYAAQMPHLLEARVHDDEHHADAGSANR